MSAQVAAHYRRLERQQRQELDAAQAASGARLSYTPDWRPTADDLLAPDGVPCTHCELAQVSHSGPGRLCPEWALAARWGR